MDRNDPPHDDDLLRFAAEGGPSLPPGGDPGHVEHDGARLWSALFGAGPVVVLLHGGLGHGGNWGHQVATLVEAGYRALVIDSRGHGRSTRDGRPFTYERMASDVLAVMDARGIGRAALVGWSDGAVVALVVAMQAPERVGRVLLFGCAMDPGGLKRVDETDPLLGRCFGRHAKDYAALSATPTAFRDFAAAVDVMMKTQPDYAADRLARIAVPVTIVQAESDEFIDPAHAAYLARTIPHARLVTLPGVSHFAPLQRPQVFGAALLAFLGDSAPG